MQFKKYLQELSDIGVEDGQAIAAHEPTGKESVAILNSKTLALANLQLSGELNGRISSPEEGIQKIRKVLYRFSLDLPALYDADPEGDEVVIDVDQFGDVLGDNVFSVKNWDELNSTPNDDNLDGVEDKQCCVYILYYPTDEGDYDFYAEIGDDDRMEELLSEEVTDNEEK
jgi:hypothetical protein